MDIALMENRLAEYRDVGDTARVVEAERQLLAEYEMLRLSGLKSPRLSGLEIEPRESRRRRLMRDEFLTAMMGDLNAISARIARERMSRSTAEDRGAAIAILHGGGSLVGIE